MAQLPFTPGHNGFLFNNTWHLAEPDKKRYQRLLLVFDLVGIGFLVTRKWGLRNQAKWGLAALLQFILIIAYQRLDAYAFGLCGGMSFTEFDYFRAGQRVPMPSLATHPSKHQSDERRLRAYIWARTQDSLILNTPRVILWMLLGHFHPDRHQVVKTKTRIELDKLKNILGSGSPWPICLIGTTWSPFLNHQVLAVGYEEQRSRITLSVHDSNCPAQLSHISFDFVGPQLVTRESCPGKRGALQSIFCETWRASELPLA